MHVPAHLVSAPILIVAWALAMLALVVALRRANWRALAMDPRRLHLVGGGAVACLLLWLMNIHLVDGVVLHFLGVTTLTLVVGWSLTILAASLAVTGFFALQGLDWTSLGLSICLSIVVPASLTRMLVHWLYRPKLRHPFVYILGAGFAGGGLVVLSLSVIAVLLFWIAGLDAYVASAAEWWPLIFLVMFSEGFLNGMCVSALAVFHPDWVKTFDDRFYLDGT
ncbi:MAG: energy-coupling factor ABC transporter permease [Pseudomonadota bacterium]